MEVTNNPFLSELHDEHRKWLSVFDSQFLRNWEKLLKSNIEAAMTEAGIRRFLESQSVLVEPNEELTGAEQRPDFKCQFDGQRFYVEVTHISTQKAEKITGLSEAGGIAMNPTPLNKAIKAICSEKAVQCSNQDAPVLIAVGTFHGAAAMYSFSPPWPDMILTGMTEMSVTINKATLSSVGGIQQTSELQSAAFLRFEQDESIGFARSSISGMLLCGLSLQPTWVIGLLHPNPARPFTPALLPRVSFGEVEVLNETGDLRVRWPEGSSE